jgi:hypothetical protein
MKGNVAGVRKGIDHIVPPFSQLQVLSGLGSLSMYILSSGLGLNALPLPFKRIKIEDKSHSYETLEIKIDFQNLKNTQTIFRMNDTTIFTLIIDTENTYKKAWFRPE